MRLISFITDSTLIQKILKHLGLWEHKTSRDPPTATSGAPIIVEYEKPYISID